VNGTGKGGIEIGRVHARQQEVEDSDTSDRKGARWSMSSCPPAIPLPILLVVVQSNTPSLLVDPLLVDP